MSSDAAQAESVSQEASRAAAAVTQADTGSLAALAAVAILASVALAGVLSTPSEPAPPANSTAIAIVAPSEIDAALQTLDPASAAALAAEARACRAPLAYVTVSAAGPSQATNSQVRIRSGTYLSPPFLVTPQPQRIAIPFPAPYGAGVGTISLEGNARGVAAHLTPAWRTDYLFGRANINVRWQPRKPC